MPALLTSTSRPPSASIRASAAATEASSVTSSCTKRAPSSLAAALAAGLVAGPDVDGVPGGDELAGGFLAEAFVRPGDQCRCHGFSCRRRRRIRQSSGFPGTRRARTNRGPTRTLGVWNRGSSVSGCGAGGTVSRRTWSASPSAGGGGRAGLRREELAGLAGISADYLTRLEQGRATAPSAQVVESLATALRLSDTERDLLYRLAGHATPGPGVVPSRITAERAAPAGPADPHAGRRVRRHVDADRGQRPLRRAHG